MNDPREALVQLMVMASAADREVADPELDTIGAAVNTLPIFDGFDLSSMTAGAARCQEMLRRPGGLDLALDAVKAALPPDLRTTAYVLAADVVASDGWRRKEERRLLKLIAERFEIDPAFVSAVSQTGAARYAKLDAALVS
ncbi:MAG TPA: tellurite resistance TerB family protein [Alphaproteobacteria bacterium]|nr:tellurite resistance TerB family protein [Alphaproteobacteria bacterium]